MVDVMALQIISPYLHFEQRPCVFDYTFLQEVLYVTTGNPAFSLALQLWLLKCCKNRNFYCMFYIYVK